MSAKNIDLTDFLQELNFHKIFNMFANEQQDQFGGSICTEVLKEAELFFNRNLHGSMRIKYEKLNRDGNQRLADTHGFNDLKGIIPVSGEHIRRDQWGYKNGQNTDDVYVIYVYDFKSDNIRQRIPLFVEIDSGSESYKKSEKRRGAMKMWQSTAAGHLLDSVKFTATLRIETQMVDTQLANLVKSKSSSMTEQDVIMHHFHDLAKGIMEIIHALIVSVVAKLEPKYFALQLIDKSFFRPMHDYLKSKGPDEHLFDYHFFIGHFEFGIFDYGATRNLTPYPSPQLASLGLSNKIDVFEEYKAKYNNDEFKKEFGKTYIEMAQYLKNGKTFYRYNTAFPETEKNARYLDGFWDKQSSWTCTIQHAAKIFSVSHDDKSSKVNGNVYMHRISVERVDFDKFDRDLQTYMNAGPAGPAVAMQIPKNMFYFREIIGLLDKFIDSCGGDEIKLNQILKLSFDTKATVRIPESSSYKSISFGKKQNFDPHFFKYSGYALFIEPFVNAMENVLFHLANDMFTLRLVKTHTNYNQQIKNFRDTINLGKFRIVPLVKEVKIDHASLNLGNVCLSAFQRNRHLKTVDGSIVDRPALDRDLRHYLETNFQNENLEAFCRYMQCYNKHLLLKMVQMYMRDEHMQEDIKGILRAFPIGIHADITNMIQHIFADNSYSVESNTQIMPHLAREAVERDDSLKTGKLSLVINLDDLPCLLEINLDRALVYNDGDLNYSTGKWKIFTNRSGASTDLFNVYHEQYLKFWNESNVTSWLNFNLVNPNQNCYLETRKIVDKMIVDKLYGIFFFFSSMWNVPIVTVIESETANDVWSNVHLLNQELKINPKYQHILYMSPCINPLTQNHLNKISSLSNIFTNSKNFCQMAFNNFNIPTRVSDSNYIILYMQVFLRCAKYDYAFDHCYKVLDKYVRFKRQREHGNETTTTSDLNYYAEFDLFNNSTPQYYHNPNNPNEGLKYVLPFYELYKAIYIAKLFAWWYREFIVGENNTIPVYLQLKNSLHQVHTPFQTYCENFVWGGFNSTYTDNRDIERKMNECIQSTTDTPANVFSNSNVTHTLFDNVTAQTENLLQNDIKTANNHIQNVYMHFKRFGLLVSRQYASVVELNSYLQAIEATERDKCVEQVNFMEAYNAWSKTDGLMTRYDDGSETMSFDPSKINVHTPNSFPLIMDPTLERVKTHYSLQAMDMILTDFWIFSRELYAWFCVEDKFKIFNTILHTTKKYSTSDGIPSTIDPMDDKVDYDLSGTHYSIRAHREINTYNVTQQNNEFANFKLSNHANPKHRKHKELRPYTHTQTISSTSTTTLQTFQTIALERETLLLHQILNTFFLVSCTPQLKRVKMCIFLYNKFECMRNRYLPYELMMIGHESINKETWMYDDYVKDILICIRKYEAYDKHAKVLKSLDDAEYLETVTDPNKQMLISRVDPEINPYADHKIISSDANNFPYQNRNWFDKQVKKDKQTEIVSKFFQSEQIIARAIYMAWSWKWMMYRQIRVREFARGRV
tara:strand:+ start:2890 stop:7395 length:4506 start_codon:yes stop_codon:yes gene_type:complete